jgi:hypothetical protein
MAQGKYAKLTQDTLQDIKKYAELLGYRLDTEEERIDFSDDERGSYMYLKFQKPLICLSTISIFDVDEEYRANTTVDDLETLLTYGNIIIEHERAKDDEYENFTNISYNYNVSFTAEVAHFISSEFIKAASLAEKLDKKYKR